MTIRVLPFLAAALAVAACSQEPAADESADDFAARVGGTATSSSGPGSAEEGPMTPPVVATPLPGAAPGPMERGTQTDPASQSCGAPKAAEFLGQVAVPDVRVALQKAIAPVKDIRFRAPGAVVTQDFRNTRLNVMLDATGTIRDLRCG